MNSVKICILLKGFVFVKVCGNLKATILHKLFLKEIKSIVEVTLFSRFKILVDFNRIDFYSIDHTQNCFKHLIWNVTSSSVSHKIKFLKISDWYAFQSN